MFDRQVNEQEDPLANRLREEGSERKVRGWPLFAGLLLLLIMAGFFVFRWRLTERTQAMEAAPPAEVLSANSTTKTVADNINPLPLSITVLDMDPESGQLEVEVAGQSRRLSIQTADSTLMDAEGHMFEGSCAMLHKELTITEGDWLEEGNMLQARQLVVSGSSPSISLPAETTLAPLDTFAYLAERRPGAQSDHGFGAFIALSEDGRTTHLTTLPLPISSGYDIQSKIPWPPRFLLTLGVPNCDQLWLLMYDPQQGIVERWLTSYSEPYSEPYRLPAVASSWRPLEERFILTGAIGTENRSNSERYFSYWSATPGKPLHLLGGHSEYRYLLGFLAEKMVTFDGERIVIELIDLKSGEIAKSISLAGEIPSLFILSEDRKRIFYTGSLPGTLKAAFNMLEIESGQKTLLLSDFYQESSWLPVRGGSFTSQALLLSTDNDPTMSQLVLVGTEAAEPIVIVEIPPNEEVTSALLCADGRVLMTIYDEEQTDVRMWQPDGRTKSLLKSDKQLDLLSCRP